MDYSQKHLKNWLQKHNAFDLDKLDSLSKLPNDTLSNFINNNSVLNSDHFESLENTLLSYGYQPLLS